MRFNLKTVIAACALGLSGSFAAQVSALPVGVAESGGFVGGSGTIALDYTDPATPVGPVNPPANTFNTISWLSGSTPQSMGFFEGTGGILTAGGDQVVATVEHTNRFIPGVTGFDVQIEANIGVFSNNLAGPQIGADNPTIDITFVETANDGTCTDDPFGTGVLNPVGGICDDIVRAVFDLEPIFFEMDDMTFRLDFGIRPVDIADGFVVPLGPDAFVFWTREPPMGDEFTTSFEIFVTAVKVPAPTTLALLGLGIAGLGFAGKRRRSS